jgi:hypothetical protein
VVVDFVDDDDPVGTLAEWSPKTLENLVKHLAGFGSRVGMPVAVNARL